MSTINEAVIKLCTFLLKKKKQKKTKNKKNEKYNHVCILVGCDNFFRLNFFTMKPNTKKNGKSQKVT